MKRKLRERVEAAHFSVVSGVFETGFLNMQKEAHKVAKVHGFWSAGSAIDEVVPLKLALIHSEVSEALAAHRKFENNNIIGAELADVVLRTMDLAEAMGINLGKAITEKHIANENRPFMHNGKRY